MGVEEMDVLPGGWGDESAVNFSCRQEYLFFLAVDHIPVHVYIVEIIVSSDDLSLLDEIKGMAVGIDFDAVHNFPVACDFSRRDFLIGFKQSDVHIVDGKSLPGHIDVVF